MTLDEVSAEAGRAPLAESTPPAIEVPAHQRRQSLRKPHPGRQELPAELPRQEEIIACPRQERILKREAGVEISRATLDGWVMQVARC